MRYLFLCGAIVSCLVMTLAGETPEDVESAHLVITSNVPITPPQGEHLNWYELKADPEDPDNLIVCGALRNAQTNAYYGVVYNSQDGGRSWNKAFEDRSSLWVSEQSCAFGRNHTAYFVSEASLVEDGQIHHSRGTTRIFISHDGGRGWREAAHTGWADYSTSVVAGFLPNDERKLYVFYNGNSLYDEANGRGSTLEFFTASEDGATVSAHEVVAGTAERDYRGIYPSSSVVLNDGTPVVLFNGRKKPAEGDRTVHTDIGVVRVADGKPQRPVIVTTHVSREDSPACPFDISNSLAYDKMHGHLYIAYNDLLSQRCVVMLTSSSDGGNTWTVPHILQASGNMDATMYFPILAVNRDGVLGILWRGRPQRSPDCWFFSSSHDGLQIEQTELLSYCVEDASFATQSSAYLTTIIAPPLPGGPVSVEMLTFRDYLTRVGISASQDGSFHPVWSTLGDGHGELRTASVRLDQAPDKPRGRTSPDSALIDITDNLAVLYGGMQRVDHATNTVVLDLAIRNKGPVPLHGPMYLDMQRVHSDFGNLEVLNPAAQAGRNFVDISSVLDHSVLHSGATVHYQLKLRLRDENLAMANRYFVMQLQLRFYSQHE